MVEPATPAVPRPHDHADDPAVDLGHEKQVRISRELFLDLGRLVRRAQPQAVAGVGPEIAHRRIVSHAERPHLQVQGPCP